MPFEMITMLGSTVLGGLGATILTLIGLFN